MHKKKTIARKLFQIRVCLFFIRHGSFSIREKHKPQESAPGDKMAPPTGLPVTTLSQTSTVESMSITGSHRWSIGREGIPRNRVYVFFLVDSLSTDSFEFKYAGCRAGNFGQFDI